jgi:heat-inducible transcriptional repressor
MADLEERGYLSQPHTSAGRIPTDKGYRYYVDTLPQRARLSKSEESRIEKSYGPLGGEVEDMMRTTSRVLSAHSRFIGMVFASRIRNVQFKRIDFIHLQGEKILAVLVSQSGVVIHKVITIDEMLNQDQLVKISAYLNEVLGGLTLEQVRSLILSRMAEEKVLYDELVRYAVKLSQKAFEGTEDVDFYIGGAANLVSQPEFAHVEGIQAIFSAFEEKSRLVRILDECLRQQSLSVTIGSEHQVAEIHDFSLIACPYCYRDLPVGMLGVLGPKRMEYPRIMSLVEYTARLVSRILTEMYA